jgi:hypothetical protein
MVERCPRCVGDELTAPVRSWVRPSKTVAVYECPSCRHAWFTSWNTTGLAAWSDEPARIGELL